MDSAQLQFFESAKPDPNIEWMEQTLRHYGEWMTAADLIIASANRFNDRQIRSFAAASDHVISGQLGYRHIDHSTVDEIHHCAAGLDSQAKKMSDRAAKLRRNAHTKLA